MTRSARRAHCLVGLTAALVVLTPVSVGAVVGSEAADRALTAGAADPDAVLRVAADLSFGGGPTFDPVDHIGHMQSSMWYELIYDTMIRSDENGDAVPGLATEWSTPDDYTIELTLREGVTFQDGTTFDAEAVKKAWDRIIGGGAPGLEAETRQLEAVTVVDDLHLTVTLSSPIAGIWVNEILRDAIETGVPSPAALDEFGEDYRSHPVGPGPYAVTEYVVDQRISVRRWDGYWDTEGQQLEGVDFVNTGIGAPTVTALSAGQIDVAVIEAGDVAAIEQRPGLAITTAPADTVTTVFMNMTAPPFDDVAARIALSQAIDRDEVNAGAFRGQGTPTDQIFGPDASWFSEAASGRYPYDPEAAEQAWTEAGWPTQLTAITPALSTEQVTTAEIIQAQLAEIGIDLEIIQTQNYTDDIIEKSPNLAITPGRYGATPVWLTPAGLFNPWTGYTNPDFETAWADTQSAGLDSEGLADAWGVVQQILTDDVAMVPMVNTTTAIAHTDRLQGITIIHGFSQRGLDLRTVYLTE